MERRELEREKKEMVAENVSRNERLKGDGYTTCLRNKRLIYTLDSTGIVPFDPEQVLRKIPGDDSQPENVINKVLIDYVQQQRFTLSRKDVRRKKLMVQPGKSGTAINEDSESETEVDEQTIIQTNMRSTSKMAKR
ncbi:hypothetical protein QE152_g19089 [Popillia japonica]|uniref:Uncharacterized protein n=1 Tax=Popillia japonica TaxID=7064 RepID=A0AAW1L351_POPJA